jgi:hypothetical protein
MAGGLLCSSLTMAAEKADWDSYWNKQNKKAT